MASAMKWTICLPSTESMAEIDPLGALQVENARLIALLESHGIEWRAPPAPAPSTPQPEPSRLSTAEKVALFRRLFRGRTDVYPVRWESKTSGKSGYVGCLDAARELLKDNRIRCDLQDERYAGEPIDVSFVGTLRLAPQVSADHGFEASEPGAGDLGDRRRAHPAGRGTGLRAQPVQEDRHLQGDPAHRAEPGRQRADGRP